MSNKIVGFAEISGLIRNISEEFAVVANPPYIYPPVDIYPLAPKKKLLSSGIKAVVMDMDGTTTTTEPLCVHALETMVRRCSGRETDPNWTGLDPETDYPHIIGNSTTKHVEFLVLKYRLGFVPRAVFNAYIRGTIWTLIHGKDPQRRRDAQTTLLACGLDSAIKPLLAHDRSDAAELTSESLENLYGEHATAWQKTLEDSSLLTRIGVEIYYHRYHEVLESIGQGNNAASGSIPGTTEKLVKPMPGIGIFLALVKGILGEHAGACAGLLRPNPTPNDRAILSELGVLFQEQPIRTGLVTSSILYEADLVLSEIFRQLMEETELWPVPADVKRAARSAFQSHHAFYDTVVTATDSHEIRLKPHRDLYSIALSQLGLGPADFDKVIGFEDSESGTIAMRAAGIGAACAVPFHMTEGHTFDAAAWVCPGGLPEVLLDHRLFIASE